MILRPLSVGEIIDAGIFVLRKAGVSTLVVSMVVFLPAPVLLFLGDQVGYTIEDPRWFGLTFWILLFAGFVIVETYGATLVKHGIYGPDATPRELIAETLRLLPKTAGARLISLAGALIMGLFVIAPGIYVLTAWSVCTAAIALEETTTMGSLQRSYNLSKQRIGPVFGWLSAVTLLTGVVYLGAISLIELVGLTSGATGALELSALYVSAVVTAALVGTGAPIMFVDLKVRLEGHDVEWMSRQLTTKVVEPPPTLITEPSRAASVATGPIWEPPT